MPNFEAGPNPAKLGAKIKDRAAAKLNPPEDDVAEQAILFQKETERERELEAARETEKRAAQNEAFKAEQEEEKNRPGATNQQEDFSPEEAALQKTEADRASAAEAAVESEKGAAQNAAFEAEQQQAAADAARLPLHEQRRIAREQAAQREREEGERLERELTRLEDAYARAYGQAKARQGLLARTLGWHNIEDSDRYPEVRQAREAYAAARGAFNSFRLRQLEGQAGTISEQELRLRSANLATEIFQGHDLRLQAKKNEQREMEDLQRGWFSRKVENGFNKAVQWYRNQKWYVKLLAAGGLALAGGWAAVAGMGAMRIIGGAAAGKGTQELFQHGADSYRKRRGAERTANARRIMEMGNLSPQERMRALQNIAGQYDQGMNRRFSRMERGDIARRHVGILTGMVLGSGVAANYIRETIGDWWTGKGGGGTTPEAPGTKGYNPGGPPMVEGGAKAPGIGNLPEGLYDADGKLTPKGDEYFKQYNIEPFDNPPKEVPAPEVPIEGPEVDNVIGERVAESGSNPWRMTQSMIKEMGPDRAGEMGFGTDGGPKNYDRWVQWKTAKLLEELGTRQGGKIHDLIHPGDTMKLMKGTNGVWYLEFGETSGMKSGHLSDLTRTRGGGGGALYEQGGGRGAGATGLEEYDRQIAEARVRGQAAQAQLDENMRYRREVLNPEYEAAASQEGAMMNLRSNYALLDKMMQDSMGGGFKLSDRVEDVARTARSFATLPGGQMPETLSYGELDMKRNSASLFSDLFRRFPYQPGQRMDDYLAGISNTDMLKLRKLYNL
jgi:chemotaxis protein histidine kinase CheA